MIWRDTVNDNPHISTWNYNFPQNVTCQPPAKHLGLNLHAGKRFTMARGKVPMMEHGICTDYFGLMTITILTMLLLGHYRKQRNNYSDNCNLSGTRHCKVQVSNIARNERTGNAFQIESMAICRVYPTNDACLQGWQQ